MARAARQADAGADAQLALLDADRLGQPFEQAAAQAFEDVAGDRPDHHDGELVAAEAVGPGLAAAQLGEHAGAFLDQLVADEVAVVVVDRLEAVEIDQRQRDLVVGIGEAADVEVQRTAVGQTR